LEVNSGLAGWLAFVEIAIAAVAAGSEDSKIESAGSVGVGNHAATDIDHFFCADDACLSAAQDSIVFFICHIDTSPLRIFGGLQLMVELKRIAHAPNPQSSI
jgi:hypothetical protein